jgi:hypothetical protein
MKRGMGIGNWELGIGQSRETGQPILQFHLWRPLNPTGSSSLVCCCCRHTNNLRVRNRERGGCEQPNASHSFIHSFIHHPRHGVTTPQVRTITYQPVVFSPGPVQAHHQPPRPLRRCAFSPIVGLTVANSLRLFSCGMVLPQKQQRLIATVPFWPPPARRSALGGPTAGAKFKAA